MRPADELATLERRAYAGQLAAHIGFFGFGLALFFLAAPDPGAGFARSDVTGAMALDTAVVVPPFILLSRWQVRRVMRRATGWLICGRGAQPSELRLLERLPWTIGVQAAPYWVGGFVIGMVLLAPMYGPGDLSSVGIGGAIGSVGGLLLAVLIVERVLGRLFGLVPEMSPEWRPRLGVQVRVVIAWAVGVSLPLTALTLAPDRLALEPLQWFVLSLALVTSLVLVIVVLRAFVRPLRAVEAVLDDVREGELGVNVVVDDGGEVGQLQRAVKGMVEGLRERWRIRELFGRHVGQEVAERALGADGSNTAVEVEVTAVFVDIIGSTRLASSVEPAAVVETLNRFFGAVSRIVAEEGGNVQKFHGDGALVIFGAPAEQPEHALCALRASRRIHAEVTVGELTDAGVDIGIGISSGTVVAGNVGAEDRYEYTVIGDPVNEASRLCDAAKRTTGRVLAAERTLEQAPEESRRWAKASELHLRGRPAVTVTYHPVG